MDKTKVHNKRYWITKMVFGVQIAAEVPPKFSLCYNVTKIKDVTKSIQIEQSTNQQQITIVIGHRYSHIQSVIK